MNSKTKSEKLKSIRVFGQRSIDSTFRPLPPNPSGDSEGSVRNQASRKSEDTHLSLSHFLDRKLPKSTLVHQTVPGKSTPFLSPLGLRIPTRDGQVETVKQVEEKNSASNDKVIFEGFKQTEEEKADFVIPLDDVDELENALENDSQGSRKRKNPFEGGNENQTVRKHVVVLGGESKLKPKGQSENDSSNKKSRPLYNHYANGRGWWDYDMEGVDNEELGFSEVWEGVGSTSLGGIVDWH